MTPIRDSGVYFRSSRIVGVRIILWSITSALAGFLFGFDTVVISGAERQIQALWNLSPGIHGVVIASALYGTVLGSMLGGWPADKFGRRATLIFIGVLYLVGATWSALGSDVYSFIIARAIGGLGIGMSTVAAPLYIAEIAPPQYRGRLAGMFQFNIVFGIVIAYMSNALLSGMGSNAWRWMIGVAAVPSLIYTLLCLGLPESPRWLLSRKRDPIASMRVLKLIRPDASDVEIKAEVDAMGQIPSVTGVAASFWNRGLRVPIMLAILIAFFNQMSGINAILYFSPRIFELTGLGAKAALLQSVGVGVTNLGFTFIGLWLIDRLGRRTLLFIGSLGYIASLSLVAYAFFTAHYSIVPVCIFAFIAAHAIGQGVTIWVYIAEIFPNRQRAQGQALGSFTHWIFAALLTTLFPKAVAAFPPAYVFSFFAGMMVLQLLWVKTQVIETKGVPLERIAERLGTKLSVADAEYSAPRIRS
jgi:SP family arabinose:H+ symporter-like MFS transporter